MPYTLDKFAQFTKFDKWTLSRYVRLILNVLKIRLPERTPLELITSFGNSLHVSYEVQQYALRILTQAQKCGFVSGKDPKALAAAALYIAALKHNEFRSQKEIAKVINVTEITIRY